MKAPFFTIVIPVLNGGRAFEHCLAAVRASSYRDFELIVVDDGSTDGSAAAAAAAGATVLATTGRCGPGAARNLGAKQARGEFLFFTDADCEMGPETLARAAAVFDSDPGLEALFGSYDDSPAAGTLIAQYKNLQHHFVHQNASPEGETFWTGCGAMRRTVFLKLGGFDADTYRRPSIEDIELGYRLRAAGGRIRVAPDVQVKHHKAWTLSGLVRADLLDRGLPWARLMLRDRSMLNDLNTDTKARVSVMTTYALLGFLVLALFDVRFLVPAAACVVVLLAANWDIYSFFARKRGILFAAATLPLHALYHLICGVAFAWGTFEHHGKRLLQRPPG